MRIFGYNFSLERARPPVSLVDVQALSEGNSQRLDELAAEIERQGKQIEAMRKKVYRDITADEAQHIVGAPAPVYTTPSGNSGNAWRTGDPV